MHYSAFTKSVLNPVPILIRMGERAWLNHHGRHRHEKYYNQVFRWLSTIFSDN